MIKKLLLVFLSVCYVFAGERTSLTESNGVCEGRIVFKNMDSCLEVVDSGTCVATDARIAKNTPEEVTDLVVLKNPWSDMGLSPCSMHQSPPLYMVTLPHEQKIILLGTTHDFPLTCMLPYGLAQDLIEQSAFVFNEIFGELFKGGPSEVKAHFVLASLLGFNSPPKLDNLPDFCYTSKDCIKKIEDCTRAFYKQFNSLYPDQLSIESEVVKTMASIFDKNGKWYQKAGIVLRNETGTAPHLLDQ